MPREFTTTTAVRVVNNRPRQYQSGLVISCYLEVDFADAAGNKYSTIAGIYMASNSQRDLILRSSPVLFRVQLGDQLSDGMYELIDARIDIE